MSSLRRSGASMLFLFCVFGISRNAEARKVALVFNGGGTGGGEILKDAEMKAESLRSIETLAASGYEVDSNIFVRDGSNLGTYETREASGADFLTRVRQICSEARAGDDIFISLGGHGVPDPSKELGPASVPGSLAVGYGHDNPQMPQPASKELIAAVDTYIEKFREASRLLADVNTRQNKLGNEQIEALMEKAKKAYEDENKTLVLIGKLLGLEATKVSELLFHAQNHYDFLSVTPFAANLAAFIQQKAQSPESIAPRNAPAASLENGVSVEALGQAISNCKKNQARVRIVGTQCYSGAFNSLADQKGLLCVASLTGPFSTSSAFDLWRASDNAPSISGMLKRARDREDNDPDSDQINNEPMDSSETVIAKWVDHLRDNCEKGVSMVCVEASDLPQICAAMGKQAPAYFKRSPSLFEQGAVSRGLAKLVGFDPPPAPGNVQGAATRVNTGLESLLAELGESTANVQSAEDGKKLAKLVIDRVASDPIFARKAKLVFMINTAINNKGELDPAVKEGLTGHIAKVIGATVLWRSSNGLENNIKIVRHRKEVYTALFQKYAKGACRDAYQNGKNCLDASFVSGSTINSDDAPAH